MQTVKCTIATTTGAGGASKSKGRRRKFCLHFAAATVTEVHAATAERRHVHPSTAEVPKFCKPSETIPGIPAVSGSTSAYGASGIKTSSLQQPGSLFLSEVLSLS